MNKRKNKRVKDEKKAAEKERTLPRNRQVQNYYKMKKLLGIVVLGLLLYGNAYADEIKVDQNTTITELLDAGYKYKNLSPDLVKDKYGRKVVKIFTLKKRNSIIICTINITISTGYISSTRCKKA